MTNTQDVGQALVALWYLQKKGHKLPNELSEILLNVCHAAYTVLQQRLAGKARLDVHKLQGCLDDLKFKVDGIGLYDEAMKCDDFKNIEGIAAMHIALNEKTTTDFDDMLEDLPVPEVVQN